MNPIVRLISSMSFENSEMTTINVTMDCIGSVEDLKCFSNPIFSLRNHINYIKDICVSYQTNDAIRNKTGESISRIFTSGETFKDEEYEKILKDEGGKFEAIYQKIEINFKCLISIDDLPSIIDPLLVLQKHIYLEEFKVEFFNEKENKNSGFRFPNNEEMEIF